MEAIVLVGIQGCGKSTFYKEMYYNTHMRINLDMLKTRNRENLFLDSCLNSKMSFVVDNTNMSIQERKKYIDLMRIKNNKKLGKIICYFFEPDLDESLRRNSNRKGKECVPGFVISRTLSRLEYPSYKEGFDEIYVIRKGQIELLAKE